MSHTIVCDVVNSWNKEVITKADNRKIDITIIEALCFGEHKHIIEGTVKFIEDGASGVKYIYLLVDGGGNSKKLYRIEDHNKLDAQVNALFRCCASPFVENGDKTVSYRTHKVKSLEPKKIFTPDGRPFKISLDFFGREEWETGVQEISLSRCTPFTSERSGIEGFNYTVAN